MRRQAALPVQTVVQRIARRISPPQAFLGAPQAFRGRVRGSTFWFRTTSGPRADWAMTLRGSVRASDDGSVITASVLTPPLGWITLGLTAVVVLLAVLRAPNGVIGPVGVLLFIAAFGTGLDYILHWHHPCQALIRHLDESLEQGAFDDE